jgi:leucyl aminopeptidase
VTTFALTDRAAHDADADALVVFAAPGAAAPRLLGALRPRLAQAIGDTATSLRARGSADEVTWLTHVPGVAAKAVLVAGVGGEPGQSPTAEDLRRAAGAAGRALAGRSSAAVVLPDDLPETAGAVTEGLGYGSYAFTAHRGPKGLAKADAHAPVEQIQLLGAGKPRAAAAAQTAVARAAVLVDEVHWARDLVNTAPNVLFPESFAERVRDRAPKSVAVHTYDAAALAELGCGGILGVGQGSVHPPVIVRMSYAPKGATSRLAYVGKGITFDSGGLSLKTPTGMITMKGDMGGAAAVAAAVLTIARLGLPVAVDGWLCLAENMPDGRAQRPGDVVTMADGTTCEIINTDAEGRLVLADGLVLASREQPDALVDIATLTGSAVVALGHRTAAVLANDDELQAELTAAATAAGESVWPMPIPAELMKSLKSDVADRKHSAERQGGALFAAAFLREYVGPGADSRAIPWGHLDIAGPAYNEKGAHGYTGKGGTGFGTRTLVALAEFRS